MSVTCHYEESACGGRRNNLNNNFLFLNVTFVFVLYRLTG